GRRSSPQALSGWELSFYLSITARDTSRDINHKDTKSTKKLKNLCALCVFVVISDFSSDCAGSPSHHCDRNYDHHYDRNHANLDCAQRPGDRVCHKMRHDSRIHN